MPQFHHHTHDGHPADAAAVIDRGLEDFNHQAAPLHEVQLISCTVTDEAGQVVGGALGRWWGRLCELQQLWVHPSCRGQGLGAQLVQAFERHAAAKGCTSFYLETLSFQAPGFYQALGYTVAFERPQYPHGIVKFYMVKETAAGAPAAT